LWGPPPPPPPPPPLLLLLIGFCRSAATALPVACSQPIRAPLVAAVAVVGRRATAPALRVITAIPASRTGAHLEGGRWAQCRTACVWLCVRLLSFDILLCCHSQLLSLKLKLANKLHGGKVRIFCPYLCIPFYESGEFHTDLSAATRHDTPPYHHHTHTHTHIQTRTHTHTTLLCSYCPALSSAPNPCPYGRLGFKYCLHFRPPGLCLSRPPTPLPSSLHLHPSFCAAGVATPAACASGTYGCCGSASSSSICGPGYYCPDTCNRLPCTAGSYCSSAGVTTPTACPAGRYAFELQMRML
jgi:hypothetical protein